MSEPTLKLPARVEALLSDYPSTEPDFEAQAKAIEARLGAPSANGIAGLLKPPALLPEPGEPAAPSLARAAVTPTSSFAEMARRSIRKDEDDSADFAKEALAAAAHARRPNAELVERVRAAGRGTATTTPLPLGRAEETPRPSGVVPRALPRPEQTARPSEPMHRGTVIGIAGTLVAIAACVALYLKSAPVQLPVRGARVAEAPAERPLSVSRPRSPALAEPSNIKKLEDLAEASTARPPAVSPGALPKVAEGAAPVAASKARPSPPSSSAQQLPVVLEDSAAPLEPPPGEPTAKEPEPQLRPAQGHSGDVPLTPSAGAVSTALGSARGNAQACLAGQTDAVTATVTFAADGHVLRVSAPGPFGACIRAALSKARIAPFARESFSAPTTIRPP
jgi:hypothetical protein